MKACVFLVCAFFLISTFGFSQLTLFSRLCTDSLVKVDTYSPIGLGSGSFVNLPYQSSMDELSIELASVLNQMSNKKFGSVCLSEVLQQMAFFASKSWKGSSFANKKKWTKLEKRFKRAKRHSTTGFSLLKCVSFRMDLTESKSDQVYFDTEIATSPFNLYYGKKMSKKEQEKGDKVPEPVLEYSFENLKMQFLKNLRSQNVLNDIKGGVYSSIGLSIVLDEKSIGRNNTFPTARVVIFFGAKRLQRIKIKNV